MYVCMYVKAGRTEAFHGLAGGQRLIFNKAYPQIVV